MILMVGKFTDVSSHNDDSYEYFKAMVSAGFKATVIKLTEGSENGSNYRNPKARAQRDNAVKAGLRVHFYHYFLGVNGPDARDEARLFIKVAKELGVDPNQSIMVCDVEDPSLSKDKTFLTNIVNEFHDEVRKAGFPHTDTYTGSSWARDRLNTDDLSTKNIWLASYGINQYVKPDNYWKKYGAWQYSGGTAYYGPTYFNGVVTDANNDYNGFYTDPLGRPSSQPTPPSENAGPPSAGSWVDDLGVRWYKETGKFTITTPEGIWLRWGASTTSAKVAVLPKGSVIRYDAFCHSGGYVWIRQPRGNGQFAYLPTGESRNGKRVSSWGTFSE